MKRGQVTKPAEISFVVNITYSLCCFGIGVCYHSRWFICLFAYYIILSVMRFGVLQIKRKSRDDIASECFAKRFTGWMLILLSLCLSGTVYLSVVQNHGIEFHEIVMITIALYTFIKITLAVINLVKVRKSYLPIYVTLRNISFADALASVFSLQRSMLVSFGEMQEDTVGLFNLLTGSAVCVAVLILGLNLIEGRMFKMVKSKFVRANEKIAESVVDGYKKVEQGVVDGYKKIEQGVVGGYSKIEDKFVERYLTRENETVEDAKARLNGKIEENE